MSNSIDQNGLESRLLRFRNSQRSNFRLGVDFPNVIFIKDDIVFDQHSQNFFHIQRKTCRSLNNLRPESLGKFCIDSKLSNSFSVSLISSGFNSIIAMWRVSNTCSACFTIRSTLPPSNGRGNAINPNRFGGHNIDQEVDQI